MRRRIARGAVCVAFALSAACESAASAPRFDAPQKLGGAEVSADVLNNGAMLYGRYCASCHGVEGDGKGPAASDLSQPPRDFQQANYRYASPDPERLPTQAELMNIIQRGVPAKGMPPWKGLREEDLSALAFYIKTFSPRWRDGASAAAKQP